jgi:hypothetical protein
VKSLTVERQVDESRREGREMTVLARGSSIESGGYLALIALAIAVICFIVASIAKNRQ